MRQVIDVEDLYLFVEKYRDLYNRRKVLDPDGLKYLIDKLFIQKGFWLDV